MLRTIEAFLWSLLIHLLIILLLVLSFKEIKDFKIPPPQSKTFTPSVPNPVTLPAPVPAQNTPVEPVEQTKKPSIKEKKSTKQIPLIADTNATKPVKKPKPKAVKKVVKKPVPRKVLKPKQMFKTVQPRPVRSKDPLANMLMASGRKAMPQTAAPASSNSFAQSMIKSVYGKEFYSYDQTQKKFIEDNLEEIFRITQNTLWLRGYPDVAVRMQIQGTNVVSFYLHPDGSISDLRLRNAIGYRALDDNTIETIKTAYKDYPRPSKKTKIMFYVKYRLY